MQNDTWFTGRGGQQELAGLRTSCLGQDGDVSYVAFTDSTPAHKCLLHANVVPLRYAANGTRHVLMPFECAEFGSATTTTPENFSVDTFGNRHAPGCDNTRNNKTGRQERTQAIVPYLSLRSCNWHTPSTVVLSSPSTTPQREETSSQLRRTSSYTSLCACAALPTKKVLVSLEFQQHVRTVTLT